MILVLACAASVLGCAVWAFSVSSDIKENVMCIVDAYNDLSQPSNFSAGRDAMDMVDDRAIDVVERIIDNWKAAAVAPGAAYAFFALLAVIFALLTLCNTKGSSSTVSKLCIVLSLLAGVSAVLFFGGSAGLGIASNVDRAKTAWVPHHCHSHMCQSAWACKSPVPM